jgi:hypothetical protein
MGAVLNTECPSLLEERPARYPTFVAPFQPFIAFPDLCSIFDGSTLANGSTSLSLEIEEEI